MKRGVVMFFIVLGVFVLSAGYFGYILWGEYARIQQEPTKLTDREQQQTYELFTQKLRSAGVSAHDAGRGFWVRYVDEFGRENVLYIDPREMSREALTQWQMDRIAGIVSKSEIEHRESMRTLSHDELPDSFKFHNLLYSVGDGAGTTAKTREELLRVLNSGEYDAELLRKLAYVYELEGNYAKRDAYYARACREFGKYCTNNKLTITVRGRVVDADGAGVQGARVEVLGSNAHTQTNEKGDYELKVGVQQMQKVRIKAVKRNFSDGIANIVIVSKRTQYIAPEIVLTSPINIVTLDTNLKTITGSKQGNKIRNGIATIHTKQSTYTIPLNAIVHRDGTPYNGMIDVYLYEFTRDTAPESLLNVDTIDQVSGYAGDIMKSFGMPYIQFFTKDGEELHVFKSNPMKLRYRIYHMDRLKTGADGIYRPLTDTDMQALVAASQQDPDGYPINREFLIRGNLLAFPAFWVFDRSRGVWEDIGVRVVDVDGTIEAPFYTINDMK